MTWIITTLWPAVKSLKTLQKFYDLWVRVLRFNFPHFNYSTAQEHIQLISSVKLDPSDPFLLLLDTQWPSVRLGNFDGSISFEKGERFRLVVDSADVDISSKFLFCDYPYLVEDSKIWDLIKIDGGFLDAYVVSKWDRFLELEALCPASIIQKRHVNLPNLDLRLPAVSQKDRDDMLFAIKNDFDYVALSFVRNDEDILQVRSFLDQNWGQHIKIVAKIENASAIKNIQNIVDVSDVVMVARWDLGVELSLREVPGLQRMIVDRCRQSQKTVIVATEMMESMISRPIPTRAEVNDVYTAVEMGADFVMLSWETSVGKYPVECVEIMGRVIWSVK